MIRIKIDKHAIAANAERRKLGVPGRLPTIEVYRRKPNGQYDVFVGHHAELQGESRVVQDDSGAEFFAAVVWIETRGDVYLYTRDDDGQLTLEVEICC